jgi:hypothetical protein
MRGLFTSTHKFNQPLYWNTSKVEDMSHLFSHCEYFDQVIDWDTSNVKNMKQMFFYCLRFNKLIYFSDTSKVENVDNMFTFCFALMQDYSDWNVNSVVNYDPQEMFRGSPNMHRSDRLPVKHDPTKPKEPLTLNPKIIS